MNSALEEGLSNRDDPVILGVAKREGKVLLTLDADFWDDRKYPLHQVHGIIFVNVSTDDTNSILGSLGLVYGCFAERHPLDWW